MPQDYKSIIQAGVAHFASKSDFLRATGTAFPPEFSDRPKKLWRDNSLLWAGGFWGFLNGGTKSYKVIARKLDGTPKLTPIESKEAYDTYSDAAMRTYRENAFYFPNGVPFLEDVTLTNEVAQEFNFAENNILVDYPVDLRAGQLLEARGKDVLVWEYQDFAKAMRPPVNGATEVIAAVQAVIATQNMTPENKILAIRKLVTNYTPEIKLT